MAFSSFRCRGSRKDVRSEPWKLAPDRIGARQTESRRTEMAHAVCPYDGFAPASILTNRLLLRARESREFLPSRPFEFQATHATSLRTRANSRHVTRSSARGFTIGRSAPRVASFGTRDRVRRHPQPPADATVTAQSQSQSWSSVIDRASRAGDPRARANARRGGAGGGARSDRRAMISH
jgi:hypothetical protein